MYKVTFGEIAEKYQVELPPKFGPNSGYLFTHPITPLQEWILIDVFGLKPIDRTDIERLDTDYDVC